METIYIVSYRSYESDDSYAFRNEEKALTDVKNDMCNTINILESQGYKPEITQVLSHTIPDRELSAKLNRSVQAIQIMRCRAKKEA